LRVVERNGATTAQLLTTKTTRQLAHKKKKKKKKGKGKGKKEKEKKRKRKRKRKGNE
jgi:hypothetical protein